jgi:hypothetical protein
MADANEEAQGKLKKGLTNLKNTIAKAIEDAASLEVTTFTGDFTFKTRQVIQADVDKFEINSVLKGMAVQNQTNLKLVAYTNVKIDADVSTIVKSDLSEGDADLLKLHMEMMQSSKDARQAVIGMVTGMIKGK